MSAVFYLTGGGAMLRGLDKRLSLKTKLPIHVADDPLRAVVRGTGAALKNLKSLSQGVNDVDGTAAQLCLSIQAFFLFLVL